MAAPTISTAIGLALATAVAAMTGCHDRDTAAAAAAPAADWGKLPNGDMAHLYTLTNANGMTAVISDYGATVVRLTAPDRSGHFDDVVLGYNTLDEYLRPGYSPFFGVIAGRYANRIAGGHFTLDGKTCTLAINNTPAGQPCSLHGGLKGFDKQLWRAKPVIIAGAQALELSYRSPDGEEGYPGTLDLTVTYRLEADNALRIDYHAVTDKPTVLNPTNHSYFNLKGEGQGDILDHRLTLHAARFTPVSPGLIPTGELRAVAGTPFDFTTAHPIGERVGADDEQLKFGGGYDHNWVIDRSGPGVVPAAHVEEPTTGRVLDVLTSEPGVQLYISNFLPKPNDPAEQQKTGKRGNLYQFRNAFCLETQHFPDSPNHPEFPTTVLRPGETFTSTTIYRFSTK
jgi:aldose 1-epimerase